MSDSKRQGDDSDSELFKALTQAYAIHCQNKVSNGRLQGSQGATILKYAVVLRIYYTLFEKSVVCLERCKEEKCQDTKLKVRVPNITDPLGVTESTKLCGRIQKAEKNFQPDMEFVKRMISKASTARNAEEVRAAIISLDQIVLLLAFFYIQHKGSESLDPEETLESYLIQTMKNSFQKLLKAATEPPKQVKEGMCMKVTRYLVPFLVVAVPVAIIGYDWYYENMSISEAFSSLGSTIKDVTSMVLTPLRMATESNLFDIASQWLLSTFSLANFQALGSSIMRNIESIRYNKGVPLGLMIAVPVSTLFDTLRPLVNSTKFTSRHFLVAITSVAALYYLKIHEVLRNSELEPQNLQQVGAALVVNAVRILGLDFVYLVSAAVSRGFAYAGNCCSKKKKKKKH